MIFLQVLEKVQVTVQTHSQLFGIENMKLYKDFDLKFTRQTRDTEAAGGAR